MTLAFDDRIIQLGIELEDGIQTFSDLYISAKGVRYAGNINNEIEVIIYNLTAAQRNYLLTQTSPFNANRTAKVMTLDVGRVSTGTFRLYQGNIVAANPTQPPDIGIILRGLTGAFALGNIIPINQPATTKLSTIAKTVAANNNLTLDFQATDKNISNFSVTCAANKQIDELGNCGGIYAFQDNDKLIVADQGVPLPNLEKRIVSPSSGMVGIPEIDELGVAVKVMMDGTFSLLQIITIESGLNPAANGDYQVSRLEFEVATRDEPFWYTVHANRYFINPYITTP